jgi:putative cardiolipin synthase
MDKRSNVIKMIRAIMLTASVAMLMSSCASIGPQPPCASDRLNIQDCPPSDAIDDARTTALYQERSWEVMRKLDLDPITLMSTVDTPIQEASGKILGPSYEDAVQSLAAKIWLIENAQYTIDATYYIFTRDLVGKAVLGALCNAVKRGVDVRLMVDSLGSFNTMHKDLKAFANCSADAGFMKNVDGETTSLKARSQTIIINALSKIFVRFNRRSHDKLMVIDGRYPSKAAVLTGGRNISLNYYGLKADGTKDPDAFRDMEILLRPAPSVNNSDRTVGDSATAYFTALSLYSDNKKLTPWFAYNSQKSDAQEALAKLKSFPEFQHYYNKTADFLSKDFQKADVRLAHELGNLISTNVVEEFDENLKKNSNSIVAIIDRMFRENRDIKHVRIVSPYLFLARYTKSTGEVIYDELDDINEWLAENPERKMSIITNSVMTSDNFFTQSVIDMDMAPRLLLPPELVEKWRGLDPYDEHQSELVKSAEWHNFINNPRIKIYETGRLDATLLGGDSDFGKLHAKFLFAEDVGFIGTTNLDYRSRLYNNEMGYFFRSPNLQEQLDQIFQYLKKHSYLWGTEEWLLMRHKMLDVSDVKGRSARRQRKTFSNVFGSNILWQL